MIARPIDPQSRDALIPLSRDGLDLYLVADGTVRVAIVQASSLAAQMAVNHETTPAETMALAEAYVSTLLLGSTLKNDERLGLLYDSNGTGFSCDVDGAGNVRGYLRHDQDGRIPRDHSGHWNGGTLGVIRYQGRSSTPFHGEIEVPESMLDRAVEAYIAQSEQTIARVSILAVPAASIVIAGGLVVQAMPGAEEYDVEETIRRLNDSLDIDHPFGAGRTPSAFVSSRLAGQEVRFVGSRRAEFHCGCSRERFGRFLSQLPVAERDDILRTGPLPLVTTCHNCNTSYSYEREELERLFTEGDRE